MSLREPDDPYLDTPMILITSDGGEPRIKTFVCFVDFMLNCLIDHHVI